MVQGLFSRETDPLIIDTRCMAKPVPHKIYLMEHAKSVDESIRFCLVTLKIISGQETPVTLPG